MIDAKLIEAIRYVERCFSDYYSDYMDGRIASAFAQLADELERTNKEEQE